MSETKAEKALRYIAERRLTIVEVNGRKVLATCRGDSGNVHRLGHDPRGNGRWGCTCEAHAKFHRECSHLIALKMVVAV